MGLVGNAARSAGFILLVAFTAGCDDEPAQRKSFIEFLQTRIIDKPGLHVVHPTDMENYSFGDYAKHYAIILDFNDGLSKSVAKPMEEAIRRGAVRTIEDVMTHHADFVTVRDGVSRLHDALEKAEAAADAAHAALKQPDDLRAVFDKAYDRTVTAPAKAFLDAFPLMTKGLSQIIEFGDFLDQHRADVTVRGANFEVKNPAIQAPLQKLLDAINQSQQEIEKAKARLRSIAYG